jgi:hypothetical protein
MDGGSGRMFTVLPLHMRIYMDYILTWKQVAQSISGSMITYIALQKRHLRKRLKVIENMMPELRPFLDRLHSFPLCICGI